MLKFAFLSLAVFLVERHSKFLSTFFCNVYDFNESIPMLKTSNSCLYVIRYWKCNQTTYLIYWINSEYCSFGSTYEPKDQ